MNPLSNTQRAYLRKLANSLRPTVMLGRQGLSPQLVAKISGELAAHELIKLRFVDHKDAKQELVATILAETGAELVGLIGNTAILFRANADPERRQIILPGVE